MAKAYSLDLRTKIIEFYYNNAFTQLEVADQFGINISTLKRILKQQREEGTVSIKPYSNGRPTIIADKHSQLIKTFVLQNTDSTLEEIRQYYIKKSKQEISVSTICRLLQKLDLRRKKKSHYAQEQDRDDVKKKT